MFSGGTTLAIQLASTVVLARLLTPRDFGLVTMVTTFSLLLVNFGFNGLTEAIVQREEMHHELASTLFWINFCLGTLLTVAFAATGSAMARLYHDPLVKNVAMGMSLTIFTTSISTVHLALLKRAMHFSLVSVNDIVARGVSVAVSILFAWMGWGYWALIAGAIALPLSTAIGAITLCRWMPGIPRRIAGTGATLSFALHTYGNFCANYCTRNTDNFLVGWRFDAHALGFYKKAYDLFSLSASQFVASISIVMLAGLSRVKNDTALYCRHLLNAFSVTAFLGMGISAVLTIVGKDLIFILLGPKWGPASQIFTFFGPGIGMMILYSTHGWIHLSAGRPDRWLRWSIFEFVITLPMFIVGLHWGPAGVATAWSVSLWVLTFPAIWYAGKPVSLHLRPVVSIIWRYIAASVISAGVAMILMKYVPALTRASTVVEKLIHIAGVSAFIIAVYLIFVVLFHHSLAPLWQIWEVLKRMFQRKEEAGVTQRVEEVNESAFDQSRIPEKNLPLVSILIPAYNAEKWIADAIRSAKAQIWPRTEIIVVDDGSNDSTLAIARQFEGSNVRVIAQSNQGASTARNNAFNHSHGDYIQWLDADDLLAPDKISKQMELVLQGRVGPRVLLSSAWARFMYRPWTAKFEPSPLWDDLSPQEWLLRKMQHNVFMQTSTWLVSRELTEAAGPWDARLSTDDDGEYFCRVLMVSDGVRFVPDAKVYYRVFHFNSLSSIERHQKKKIEAHWVSMKLHIDYLRSMGDSANIRRACLQFLQDSLIYFYPEQSQIVQQANEIADELGMPLGVPMLSRKYAMLKILFGWTFMKLIQNEIRKYRWNLAKNLDRVLFWVQRQQRYSS